MPVGALGALDFDLSIKDRLTGPMIKMFNASTALEDGMKEVSKAVEEFGVKENRRAMFMGASNVAMVALIKNAYEYLGTAWKLHAAVSANIQSTSALVAEQWKLRTAYGATAEEIKAVTGASALLKVSGTEMSELNNTILEFGEASGLGASGAAKLSEFLVRDLMIPTKDLRPAFEELGQVIRSVKISGEEAATGLRAADAVMSRMTVDARAKQLPAIIKVTGAFKDMGVGVDVAMDAMNRMMDVTDSTGVVMTSRVARSLGITSKQLREGLADGSIDAAKAMDHLLKSMTRNGHMNARSILQMKIQAGLMGINEKDFNKMVRATEKGGAATKGFNNAIQGTNADSLTLAESFKQVSDPIERWGSKLGEIIVSVGGLAGGIINITKVGIFLAPMIWGAVTATWAFTTALLANPITWVVIAIVALIGGIVLLQNKFNIFGKAWDLIVAAWNWGIGIIKKLGSNILWFLGPIGWAIKLGMMLQQKFDIVGKTMKFVGAVWDALVAGFKTGINWLIEKFAWVTDLASKLFDAFMGGDLGDSFLATAFEWLLKMMNPLNMIISGFKKIKSWFKSGPSTEEPIKAMASGGIVTSPTVALIGERGPEAVVPLSRASQTPTIIGTNEIIRTLEKLIDVVKTNGSKDQGSGGMDLGMDYPIYRLISGYGV